MSSVPRATITNLFSLQNIWFVSQTCLTDCFFSSSSFHVSASYRQSLLTCTPPQILLRAKTQGLESLYKISLKQSDLKDFFLSLFEMTFQTPGRILPAVLSPEELSVFQGHPLIKNDVVIQAEQCSFHVEL